MGEVVRLPILGPGALVDVHIPGDWKAGTEPGWHLGELVRRDTRIIGSWWIRLRDGREVWARESSIKRVTELKTP